MRSLIMLSGRVHAESLPAFIVLDTIRWRAGRQTTAMANLVYTDVDQSCITPMQKLPLKKPLWQAVKIS